MRVEARIFDAIKMSILPVLVFVGTITNVFAENTPIPVQKSEDHAAPTLPDVKDLPLIELPAVNSSSDLLGVFISGDGGWWNLDRVVSETLVAQGVAMIGISSYKYFHTPRTPESAAQDVARILVHYLAKWHKEKVVLVGYSFGAEVLPFIANRLPGELSQRVQVVALIAPSASTCFEFHITDWIKTPVSVTTYPVQPEIEKLKGAQTLCLCGDKDADCICSRFDSPSVKSITFAGDHHFAGKFKPIGEAIWNECTRAGRPGA